MTFWILDSGASSHFTRGISDFESFETLHILLSIQTASGSMYITGKRAVTLKHLDMQKNMVETIINNVFFCNNLICWLLSLGAFWLNRLIISGIEDLVTIKTHNGTDFMIFQPRILNDIIYMLQMLG